jgi:hypothetical protein
MTAQASGRNSYDAGILPAGISADLGLDLTRPDELTDAEQQAYRRIYEWYGGRPHLGLNFWLENGERIDILKRYRIWAVSSSKAATGEPLTSKPSNFGFIYFYGMTGYTAGVRYITTMMQREGLTREQILEGLSVAYIWIGPRGMDTIARALDGFDWSASTPAAVYPANWQADPEAFRSGIDLNSPDLSPAELARLQEWYLRVEGEIPRYVDGRLADGGRQLKAYRHRFETALRTLPKQVMPYVMLDIHVTRGNRQGIREGVLLARGFDMTRAQTIEAIASGMFYGGVETGSIAAEAAGDILDNWTGPV